MTVNRTLVPAPPSPLAILDETVTVPVADLYDLLTRKERPMPETNRSPRAPRGFRRVTVTLPSDIYRLLEGMAREESRSPEQQAAFMLRRVFSELAEEAKAHTRMAAYGRALSDAERADADDEEETVAEVGER